MAPRCGLTITVYARDIRCATLEQEEHAASLRYLGSIITETNDCGKEITTRLGSVRSVMVSLNCLCKDSTVYVLSAISLNMSLKRRLKGHFHYGCAALRCDSQRQSAIVNDSER